MCMEGDVSERKKITPVWSLQGNRKSGLVDLVTEAGGVQAFLGQGVGKAVHSF